MHQELSAIPSRHPSGATQLPVCCSGSLWCACVLLNLTWSSDGAFPTVLQTQLVHIQVSAEHTAFPNLGDGIRLPAHPCQSSWTHTGCPWGSGTAAALPTIMDKTSLLFLCSQDKPHCSLGLVYPEQVYAGQNQRREPQTSLPLAHLMPPGCAIRHGTVQNCSLGAHSSAEWTSHVSPFAQWKNQTEIPPLQAQGFIFLLSVTNWSTNWITWSCCSSQSEQGVQTVVEPCTATLSALQRPGALCQCCDGLCLPNTARFGKTRGFGGFTWTPNSLLTDWWLSVLSSTASNEGHIVGALKAEIYVPPLPPSVCVAAGTRQNWAGLCPSSALPQGWATPTHRLQKQQQPLCARHF